ncbi:MAG: 3-keto-5-aminohexanoate cleavage protein [Polyangiaceae bacterium]|nr:3-keto-5-aminohexanoate cleavage protein [Polyangiaceae bacterium]
MAPGSAPLVARAAAYARELGREPASPARARVLLGLRCDMG